MRAARHARGWTLDELAEGAGTPDPRIRRPEVRRDGIVLLPLAPEGSAVRTYRITYPPVRTLPELRTHDGYEWFYVLSGRLPLRLGERDLTLGRGEAAEFDTGTPHAVSAAGGAPAKVISIFNDEGERMHTHVVDGAPPAE